MTICGWNSSGLGLPNRHLVPGCPGVITSVLQLIVRGLLLPLQLLVGCPGQTSLFHLPIQPGLPLLLNQLYRPRHLWVVVWTIPSCLPTWPSLLCLPILVSLLLVLPHRPNPLHLLTLALGVFGSPSQILLSGTPF